MKSNYLKNGQIRLRASEPEDLGVMYEIENTPELWEVSSITVPYSRFALKQYIENSTHDLFADRQLRLMIELNSNKDIAGCIDLSDFDPLHRRAAVGIMIKEEYRSKGIARQALDLLCSYCFHFLHLKQLYSYITSDNSLSIKLFYSCGFTESGILKDWILSETGYKDAVLLQKVML